MDKSLEAKKFLAVNQQSCNELLTFVDFAQGFTIGFVEINFPSEADIVIDFLKSHPQCEQIQFKGCSCYDGQYLNRNYYLTKWVINVFT